MRIFLTPKQVLLHTNTNHCLIQIQVCIHANTNTSTNTNTNTYTNTNTLDRGGGEFSEGEFKHICSGVYCMHNTAQLWQKFAKIIKGVLNEKCAC